jgi:tRNA U34 5-methylaminomethyl-2-thiouridine-forming methyltransferase MnmC
MERKIITTSDGSHSIFVPELNEHYHSTHGAIQESRHVFIEAGLKHFNNGHSAKHVRILEIGLGTGLNALLTYIESERSNVEINYISIEAFPVSEEVVKQLNYADLLAGESAMNISDVFHLIHSCEWEKENQLSKCFSIKKIKNTLQKVTFENEQFDLIYFDAFGPPTQPEMWTEEIFSKLSHALKTGGALVTYCAKGEVKRSLKKTGFMVESLPDLPENGKW